MFFVVNKEKVYSYIVTLSVIGVLFTISAVYPKEVAEVSAQNTYSVQTTYNEVNVVENSIKN